MNNTDTPTLPVQKTMRMIVFRMPENLKKDFRVALMKNNLDVQHTLEAFAEVFIAYTEGDKPSDAIRNIIRRSLTLANGV